MQPFSLKANAIGFVVATFLSWRGIKKKGLTRSGAATAFCVGFLLVCTGLRGFNLLVFYLLGTKATKFRKEIKQKMDGTVVLSGTIARGPSQVLACSLLAVILSLVHGIYCGEEKPIDFGEFSVASKLTCGVVAHHATCLADTLASELGILATSPPVLIIQPWRGVPPGTNGGVTLLGCFWSGFGGLLMGLFTIAFDFISGISPLHVVPMLAFSTCCGLLGSLLDSLLGATIQQSLYDPDSKLAYQSNDDVKSATKVVSGSNILTNEQVNLVSVAATTFLGGWVLGPFFFP
ncbi:unnamed protein product [Cylindrotheca closterium]|uniref:Transmembrane protein 19 n=1 Tax=Cylindrotheca closterium TaxID=2856 RepID=A0AAD2CV70_9STRA|nr:unnamed protein product [Cylindrotheca closterium]